MHLKMALFDAIGSFIEYSGLTNLMEDAGLITSGSVKGFLIGKHFNRCTRLHQIVACVLSDLLFQRFQDDEEIMMTDTIN